jgi:uncharacterized protein (DUF885 family)
MQTYRSAHEYTKIEPVLQIVDEAWEEMRRSSYYVRRRLGAASMLPDLSLDEVQRRSALGESLLVRIKEIDPGPLPHDLALTLRVVTFKAQVWAREAAWYWTVIDPLGIGIFGMFLPTPYCGGWFLNQVHDQLASFSFETSEDADRYLTLVSGYARLIEQFAVRTNGQAEKGIRMPKVQVRQARELLTRLKSNLRNALGVTPERMAKVNRPGFFQELDDCIATNVETALSGLLDGLSDAYLLLAPETVGMDQYPAGASIYAELVKFYTNLDLTPEQVHAYGHKRIADIERQMHALRTALGFEGSHAAFLAHLDRDARWRAYTVESLTAFFKRYIDRLQLHFSNYFYSAPRAAFGVAPLANALQNSMTYGYYNPPGEGQSDGLYFFNSSNLAKQALFCVGSLTYHELVPGHHLQIATQQENEALHPFRQHCLSLAYVEGWAEYAATMAGEMGCYEESEEQYGRLVMDAFLTCRLVVDTGMNAMGWSLQRAQKYMQIHSAMTETEISSDSVRYSCDIPGQGLAYKLGDAKIFDLRERMRASLGARFDLKEFHATVLDVGAVPLSDLEWHVQHVIDGLIAAVGNLQTRKSQT